MRPKVRRMLQFEPSSVEASTPCLIGIICGNHYQRAAMAKRTNPSKYTSESIAEIPMAGLGVSG
jgi:hypothetical protein